MRILVITRSAWRNDNNIGNTMTNIFKGFNEEQIYGLCFRSEAPQTDIIDSCFCISEEQIVKSFLKKSEIGKKSFVDNEADEKSNHIESKMYVNAKKHNSFLLWFAREFVWSFAPWKNKNLRSFLDEASPDIIFMPVFGCWYPHKVLKYIMKYTKAKLVLFHADDNYTMRQFSLSPLYWLYRLNLRKWVKNSVKLSSSNYAISETQKVEYEKAFSENFKILYKGYSFNDMPVYEEKEKEIIKLVFTGNINMGRYKQLAAIGRALRKINSNGKKAELDIYTLTPMTEKMKKALNIPEAINMKGGIKSEEVKKVQKVADILVHVESFDLKNRLAVHQSFSTKIVDYLGMAKCILAVGPDDVASIDYLAKNDAALVATAEDEIYKVLNKIIENRSILDEYGKKAWECGKRNHQIEKIQRDLYCDFKEILNESNTD